VIDLAAYQELRIAPRAVFDQLPVRGDAVRFYIDRGPGTWDTVTWNAFAEQIRAVGLVLAQRGLARGDRAAIFAANRVEWISSALGIQAAGGVMVPVYPASTVEQASYVLSHSDAVALFVDGQTLLERALESWDSSGPLKTIVLLGAKLSVEKAVEALTARGVKVPSAEALAAAVVPFSALMEEGAKLHAADGSAFETRMNSVSLEDDAVMLYTSGTSGNPKGVPLTHNNVGTNGRDWLECNGPLVSEGDVDLLWLPMSHIFGFGEACLGNTLGFETYLVDVKNVLPKLTEVRPHVFMSVPSLWEKFATLAKAPKADGSEPNAEEQQAKLAEVTGGRLRFCLSGGAGLKREVKEFFKANGLLIIEGYGLTEASPTLTFNTHKAHRFDTVGKPIPSVTIQLAEDGEILAKGPNIFRGYHKDPVASKEAFTEDGWLKTGDVGEWTEDGFLKIVDRKKDILVTAGGKNVPPANIEQRFQDEPLVAHAVVYGDGEKFLVAGIWPNVENAVAQFGSLESPDLKAALEGVVARVNEKLASYESIKKWALVEKPLTVEGGELTATLKVRRKQVYAKFKETFVNLYIDTRGAG
jgi:long-chain acyl-CoA synthetase